MSYSETDQLLALAGVFQAAALVHDIARRGMADTQAIETSIHSIFQTDADSVDEIYGGAPGLMTGLRTLINQFGSGKARSAEIVRHVSLLLHLERKLARDSERLETIARGIERAAQQSDHFSNQHSNVMASLADTYSSTISTLRPKILVNGEPLHLSNSENVNRIRALLLAGIRSARLWHQVGGRRWKILLNRKSVLRLAEQTLIQAQSESP